MNLKTHTAYPEIQVAENNTFQLKFYNVVGKVVGFHEGMGADPAEASEVANAIVDVESVKYIKGEK